MTSYNRVFKTTAINGRNGFVIHGVQDFGAGLSVSNAGDVNGDGVDDFIFGEPRYPVGTADSHPQHGVSVLVFGHSGPWAAEALTTDFGPGKGVRLEGGYDGEQSGVSVSTAGDVNADGIADLIIGAPGMTSKGGFGAAYVMFGHQGAFQPVDLTTLDGHDGFYIFNSLSSGDHGYSVSQAGDVNGDGIDDVIVGAPKDEASSHGGLGLGAAYVVYGRAAGFPAEVDLETMRAKTGFKLFGHDSEGGAGFSVSAAGDVNGDGRDDLVIGAPLAYDDAGNRVGESFVVFGQAKSFAGPVNLELLNGANGFKIDGALPFDRAGWSVSNLGDINGDGIGDLVIGAPRADRGGLEATGESYVVYGHRGGFTPVVSLGALDGANGLTITGFGGSDGGGYSVSNAGDWNGDGFADILVGAPDINLRVNTSGPGAAYLIFGGPNLGSTIDVSLLNGDNGFRIQSTGEDRRLGYSVSAAGDINHDGLADIAMGAPEVGYPWPGDLYVLFGALPSGPVTRTGSNVGQVIHGGNSGDQLSGLGGGDVLVGGGGADTLTGGQGVDRFVYAALRDSHAAETDLITDLKAVDIIDLSAIDANTGVAGNQAFGLAAAFTHQAGQAVLSYTASSDTTLLRLDVDGDAKADAMIRISGHHTDFTNFAL